MRNDKIGIQEYFTFLESVSPSLNPSFVKRAKKVEYGQWELPFEATLLELVEIPRSKVRFDKNLVTALAQESNLTTSGVLDTETWGKFLRWELR